MRQLIPFATILVIFTGFQTLNAQTGNTGIGTTTPGSKLTVNGSFAASYRAETGVSGTIGANDYYVVWNGTGNGTLSLPAAINGAGNFKGRLYFIKNTTAGNSVTIAASGAELIDGAASISLPPGYAVNLVNTGAVSGTSWEVVSFVNATASIPQFRTSSLMVNSGSGTINGAFTTPVLIPGMSMTVSNPTGQSLNYLINCTIAMDAGFATPNSAANMYVHMYPVLFVDGATTGFRTFIEAEPVKDNDDGSSNFIGSLNGTVLLGPGNHTIEVRYTVAALFNTNSYIFNQAGSFITATTIY